MFQIETDRLYLRVLREEDLAVFHKTIYADAEVTQYLPGGVPRPIARTEATIAHAIKHQAQHGFSTWAAVDKRSGDFLGQAGIFYPPERGDVEIAYAFGRAYWGKGYATEVARASIRFGFEYAHLTVLHAITNRENVTSQKVMQKLGMTYQGLITFQEDGPSLQHYTITPDAFTPSDAYFRVTMERETPVP